MFDRLIPSLSQLSLFFDFAFFYIQTYYHLNREKITLENQTRREKERKISFPNLYNKTSPDMFVLFRHDSYKVLSFFSCQINVGDDVVVVAVVGADIVISIF